MTPWGTPEEERRKAEEEELQAEQNSIKRVKELLNSKGIRHLYHFTDEENLPLIRKHGILSCRELSRRQVTPPKPGGNDWSRRADSLNKVDKYVHLCLLDRHPMEFLAKKDRHIGRTRFLKICIEVLSFPGVMGCSEVANKAGAILQPIEQALGVIDLEILFGGIVNFQDENLRNRYNDAKKSEILIPKTIPPDLILNLY
jgi:hypothetical protein